MSTHGDEVRSERPLSMLSRVAAAAAVVTVASLGVAYALSTSASPTATPGSTYVNAVTRYTLGTMTTANKPPETISTTMPTVLEFPANADLSGVTGVSIPSLRITGNYTVSGRRITILWRKQVNRNKKNFSIAVDGVRSPSRPAAGGAAGPYSIVGTMTTSAGEFPIKWVLPAGGLVSNPVPVTNITTRPDTSTVSATTTYTIGFLLGSQGRLSGNTAAGANTITCVFPADTSVPGTGTAANVTINGVQPSALSVSGRTVTMSMPTTMTIAPPGPVAIVFKRGFGLRNPSTPGDTFSLTVSTSAESGSGTSVPYTIGAFVPTRLALGSNGLPDPGFVRPGQSAAVDRFVLTRTQGSNPTTVTGVSIDNTGTASLVTGVRVYEDVDMDGALSAADVALNSTPAVFTGTLARVNFDAGRTQLLAADDFSSHQYLVVYSFSAAAVNGQTASSAVTTFSTNAAYTTNNATRGITFTIDTVGPTATWVTPAADGDTLIDPSPTSVDGTATDSGAGPHHTELTIRRDSDGLWWTGSAWAGSAAVLTADGTDDWSYTWDLLPQRQDGSPTYTVRATPVDAAGNMGAPITRNLVHVDNMGPTLMYAVAPDPTHVDLRFSEAIEASTAAGYLSQVSFTGGLTASGAVLDADQRTLHLTTTAQTTAVPYSYSVNVAPDGLLDLHGTFIETTQTASFFSGGRPYLAVTQGNSPGWPGFSAPVWARPGSLVAVDELRFTASGGPVKVSTVTLRGLDTAASLRSDVASVALFADDGSGHFDAADTMVDTPKSFAADAGDGSSVVTFGSVSTTVAATTPASMWVVYRLGPAATDGRFLGSRVASGDVSVTTHTVGVPTTITSGNLGQTIGVDGTAPSTTSDAPATWRTTDTTITLTASADAASTSYSLDGVNYAAYAGPFAISAEGTTTLRFFSVDQAGNKEATKTAVVRIDKAGPTSANNAPAGWSRTDLSVAISASDLVSGVARVFYRLNGSGLTTYTVPVSVSTEGTNTLQYYAVDVAGNVESTQSVSPRIDKTPPATTSDAPAGWITTGTAVSLTSSDSVSGVALRKYRLNGSALTTYTGPVSVSAEGTNTLQFFATDTAGNVETTKTASIRIDKTPPVTSDNAPVSPITTATAVTLTSSDTISGVASRHYRLNGSALTTYTGPVPVSAPGTNTLEYFARDVAGNREATKTATIRIDSGPAPDTVPPVTTDNAPDSWLTTGTIVTLSGSDDSGGPVTTYYRLNGSALTTYTSAVPVTAEGTNTLEYRSVDGAGNRETTKTATVRIDKTKPGSSNDAPIGWSRTDVTVKVTAGDLHSGVAAVYYRLNSGALTTYTAPVAISAEGTNTLRYYAVDVAGNVQTTQTANARIDKTPPATTSNAPAGWIATGTAVSLTTSDALSGVSVRQYRLNGSALTTYTGPISVSAEGTNTLQFFATDIAGNVETTKTALIRIDKSRPSSSNDAPDGWSRNDLAVALAGTDSMSGVARIVYRLNGGALTTYTAPIAISAEGTNTLRYNAIDNAGNVETTQAVNPRIDKTPPLTTAFLPSSPTSESADVTLAAADALSGVAATYYRVDAGPWLAYAGPFTLSGDGDHSVEYYSADAAGNVELPRTAALTIDTQAPTGGMAINGGAALTSVATVTVDSAMDEAAVMRVNAGTGFGGWRMYAPSVVITVPAGNGVKQVTAEYVDDTGNLASVTDTITLDTTVPDSDPPAAFALLSPSAPDGLAGIYRSAPLVTLYADEPATLVYSLASGAGPWNPYMAPLAAGEGTTTVWFRATDLAGNLSPVESVTVSVDSVAPTGTTVLARGSVYASSTVVSLESTVSGAAEIAVDAGSGFSEWSAYAATRTVALGSGDGLKTVVARFRDRAGNSLQLTDTILLDTTAPSLTITGVTSGASYATTVTPVFSSADPSSSVAATLDGVPYSSGTPVGTAGTHALSVRVTDPAGNTTMQVLTFTIDTSGLVGQMRLAAGAVYATSTATTLDSTVPSATEMRIDPGTGFGSWTGYSPSRAVTLTPGDGTKTVRAQYRDALSRVLELADTIVLDTTAPDVTVRGVSEGGNYPYTVTPTASSTDAGAVLSATLNGDVYGLGTSMPGWGAMTLIVTATDPAGNTGRSTVNFTVTEPGGSGAPSAPTSLAAVAATSSIRLNWVACPEANVSGYRVYRSTLASGPFALLTGSVVSTATHTDYSASAGVRYHYRVTALNNLGRESAPSSVASAQIASTVVRGVTRLQGATRYDVAVNIAKAAYPGWVLPADKNGQKHLIVACGEDRASADPLAAAGLAGAYDAPILLTTTAKLQAPTATALRAFAAANHGVRIHIVGGPASVPEALRTQMSKIAYVGGVDRISGADRYAVTANIANRMALILGKDSIPGVLIVCAEKPDAFFDALAASPIAARDHMPMLGVKTDSVPASVQSALKSVGAGKPRYIVSAPRYIGASVYTSVGGTKRLTGSTNRYVASCDIANAAIAPANGWLSTTNVGLASKLPDSLTGGAFIGKRGGVLVFTDSTSVMQAAPKSFITSNKSSIVSGWIFGGPVSMTPATETTFRNLLK